MGKMKVAGGTPEAIEHTMGDSHFPRGHNNNYNNYSNNNNNNNNYNNSMINYQYMAANQNLNMQQTTHNNNNNNNNSHNNHRNNNNYNKDRQHGYIHNQSHSYEVTS